MHNLKRYISLLSILIGASSSFAQTLPQIHCTSSPLPAEMLVGEAASIALQCQNNVRYVTDFAWPVTPSTPGLETHLAPATTCKPQFPAMGPDSSCRISATYTATLPAGTKTFTYQGFYVNRISNPNLYTFLTAVLPSFLMTPGISSGSGNISPNKPTLVQVGKTFPISLSPDSGSYIAPVDSGAGTCSGHLDINDNLYIVDASNQKNCRVGVNFTQQNVYTINSSVLGSSGGSISPSTPQYVVQGTSIDYTLTPRQGYSVTFMAKPDTTCAGNLSVSGGIGTFVTSPLNAANCAVVGQFVASGTGYSISSSVNNAGGGSISPSGTVYVPAASSQSYRITAEPNHIVSAMDSGTTCAGSLQIDSGSNNTVGTFTTSTSNASNCYIVAAFQAAPITQYTVTSSVTGSGLIDPLGNFPVASGGTLTYRLMPSTGSTIGTVTGSCAQGSFTNTTYTTGTITADCTVIINYVSSSTTYQVTGVVQSGSGTFDKLSQTIFVGQTATFTLIPATGYQIYSASDNCGTGGGLNRDIYTTPPIRSVCQVSANFNLLPLSITALSPNSVSVGWSQTVTITGTGFVTGATVQFGTGNYGTNVVVNPSGTQIQVTAPVSSVPGAVDVIVRNPDEQSVTAPQAFKYVLVLNSITIAPLNSNLALGLTQQYTATGSYSDGTSADITQQVDWSSSDITVASIQTKTDPTPGQAKALKVGGPVFIRASLGTVNVSTNLTVIPASLLSISLSPLNARIIPGATLQYTATGTYSDGTTPNITDLAGLVWSSSDTNVATITSAQPSGNGLATASPTTLDATTTISATVGLIRSSTNLTVDVVGITPPANLTAPVDSPYSGNFTATGGQSPYSFIKISGNLPNSITLSTGGVLSGTPQAGDAGSYTFTVKATDSTTGTPNTAEVTVTLQIPNGPLTITPPSPANLSALVDNFYTAQFVGNGGVPTYSFTVISGNLPGSITLNSSSGVLSGTPRVNDVGLYPLTVRVTDLASPTSNTSTVDVLLKISAGPLTIAPPTNLAASVDSPYNEAFTATGGIPSYFFAIVAGSLPRSGNLVLNSSGNLSGTPAEGDEGLYSFTVSLKDSSIPANTANVSVTLQISNGPLTITPPTILTAPIAATYSQAFVGAGGVPKYSFAVTLGSLPPSGNIQLNSATGILAGTPASGDAGRYPITVTVTDLASPKNTASISVTLFIPAIITVDGIVGGDGRGGSITPASQSVQQASSATLTIQPNAGYVVDVSDTCGGGDLKGTTYTIGAVEPNVGTSCKVTAIFEIPPIARTNLLAVGASGSVLASNDWGMTWGLVTTPNIDNTALLNGIATDGTNTIIVGGIPRSTTTASVMYINQNSSDYTLWNSQALSSTYANPFNAIAYDAGTKLWTAVGNAGLQIQNTTPNLREPTAWTPNSAGVSTNLYAVATDGSGNRVAVGQARTIVYSLSTSQTTWTVLNTSTIDCNIGSATLGDLTKVIWTGSRWMAVSTLGEILMSSDTSPTSPWTCVRPANAYAFFGLALNSRPSAPAYGLLAVGKYKATFGSNNGGGAWTSVFLPTSRSNSFRSLLWAQATAPARSQWVGVGTGGFLANSMDGTSWTDVSYPDGATPVDLMAVIGV